MSSAFQSGLASFAVVACLACAPTALAQSVARLVHVSGEAWVNLRHGETAPPLVVKAVDASDRPVAGARISFVNECLPGYQDVISDGEGNLSTPPFTRSTSGYCSLYAYPGGAGTVRTYLVYQPSELALRTSLPANELPVSLDQRFTFEASLVFQGWRHLPLPISAEVTTGTNGATARRIETMPLFGDTRVSGEGNGVSGDYRIVLRTAGLSLEIPVAQRGPLARLAFDPPELTLNAMSTAYLDLIALDTAGLPLPGVQPWNYTRHCAGETCVRAGGADPQQVSTSFRGRWRIAISAEAVPGEVTVPFMAGTISATAKISVVTPPPEANYQDMWWAGPGENGWGMSIVQHDDALFGVIYGYDAAGEPTWWVMPGGQWNATRSIHEGSLFAPSGSPYYAYDSRRFTPGAPVGTAHLAFSSVDAAILTYSVMTPSQGGPLIKGNTTRVERQQFGSGAAPGDFGDMWWGGPSEDGWGIAVLQQQGALFSVWFTYDAAGRPTWFVMPGGQWISAGTYAGRIYRTRGSPLLDRPYDPARLVATDVGAYSMHFQGLDNARFEYEVEGRSGSLSLSRQPF